MPEYKSAEEAIDNHKSNYRSDGDAKGMFTEGSPHINRFTAIVNAIPRGAYVLEVGCNSGGLSRLLMRNGCFVCGVDVVEGLVKIACQKGIHAQVGCAEKLPYSNDKFNACVIAEVLEHLFDPKIAIDEILRVLKPGGIIAGSVPTGRDKDFDYHANGEWTQERVKGLLTKFKNVETKDISYPKDYAVMGGYDTSKPKWIFFKGEK